MIGSSVMSVAISNNSKQDQTCYDVLMGMSSKAVMAEWSAINYSIFWQFGLWVQSPDNTFVFHSTFCPGAATEI